jgi:hypothetical protein
MNLVRRLAFAVLAGSVVGSLYLIVLTRGRILQ